MSSSRRMVIIGLDMGDGHLIAEWAREGRLPYLGALIERGAWRWLDSPADTLHVSAWPSIYTGTAPGEHGVYYTFQPAPGRQGYEKFRGDQYGCPTFWNLMSRAGVRCLVFDAPYTHPEEGSRATQVFDWGTWARYWRPMSRPAPLLRRLNRACGRYPLGFQALDIGLNALEPAALQEPLRRSVQAKANATAWLMGEIDWDLLLVVFGETHVGGHYLWDPSESDRKDGAEQTRLRALYEAIDRGLRAIGEAAGAATPLVVLSGDGVRTTRAAWHLLPEVLRRLGYLAEPSTDGRGNGSEAGGEPPGRSLVGALRDAIPETFRQAVARRLPDSARYRLASRVQMSRIDWSRTKAYCLPTDLEGCVRINLKGREPKGIVAPGEEYRRVCDDLAADLARLTDSETGQPAVREVVLADEAFPGGRRHHLPDLIVVWELSSSLSGLASPGIGTVIKPSPDGRPGTHSPPGFLLCDGLDLEWQGEKAAHVCDIAPRLLSWFGVEVPGHMDRDVTRDRAPGRRGTA